MSDNKSPWGSGGRQDNNKPRPGNTSPELDNVLRGFKNRVNRGGGAGGSGGPGGSGPVGKLLEKLGPLGIGAIILGIYFLLSCVYTVKLKEEAVILRFGEYSRTTVSGLHFKLPDPIETAIKVDVTTEQTVGSAKNLVLTGDENIADVDFTVRWNIKSSKDYIFNLEKAGDVVEDAADSAIREVIGKKNLEYVITDGRNPIEIEVKALLQSMLDEYQSGVGVTVVQLQRTEAPPKVIKAYEDVVTAEQELEQRVNEGLAHRNQVTEEAVGVAAQYVESAEAYKQEVVEISKGETDRFLAVYGEYKKAPRVTRQRIYLETLEQVYGPAEKIILDGDAGSGVVPYLPLDQLKSKPQSGGQ